MGVVMGVVDARRPARRRTLTGLSGLLWPVAITLITALAAARAQEQFVFIGAGASLQALSGDDDAFLELAQRSGKFAAVYCRCDNSTCVSDVLDASSFVAISSTCDSADIYAAHPALYNTTKGVIVWEDNMVMEFRGPAAIWLSNVQYTETSRIMNVQDAEHAVSRAAIGQSQYTWFVSGSDWRGLDRPSKGPDVHELFIDNNHIALAVVEVDGTFDAAFCCSLSSLPPSLSLSPLCVRNSSLLRKP
jgi:hypothetical protein